MRLSIGYYLGLSIKTEILLLTICGMIFTMFDQSLLDLTTNLREIWSTDFSPQLFTPISQQVIKFLITGVVVIRSFTVHLYLAFYVVMIWPALFEEKAGLLLPWLVIGGIKNILVGITSCCIGLFVCIISGSFRPACGKFALKQLSRLAPSCYMWFTVLRFYRALKSKRIVNEAVVFQESKFNLEKALRRRKVRSMRSDCSLRKKILSEQVYESTSNYEYQMPEVSIRSSIEPVTGNEVMCTPLKVSRSLDALLSMICTATDDDGHGSMESNGLQLDDSSMTPVEKTKRLLRLTDSDIDTAKQNKETRDDVFNLNNNLDLCVQIAAHIQTFHNYSEHTAGKSVNSEKEIRSINMDDTELEHTLKEKGFSTGNLMKKSKYLNNIYHLIPGTSTKINDIDALLLRCNEMYGNLPEKTKNIIKTIYEENDLVQNIESNTSVKELNSITQVEDLSLCNDEIIVHKSIFDAELGSNYNIEICNSKSTTIFLNNNCQKQDASCQVSSLSKSFLDNKNFCEILSCLSLNASRHNKPSITFDVSDPDLMKVKKSPTVPNIKNIGQTSPCSKKYHKFSFVNCTPNLHSVRSATLIHH